MARIPRTLSETSATWPTFGAKRVSKRSMRSRSRVAALVCAFALVHGTAAAQSAPPSGTAASEAEFVYAANEPKRALKEGKVVRAVAAVIPPSVDGRLGDEVWTLAPIATG